MKVEEAIQRLEELRGLNILSTSNMKDVELLYKEVLDKEFIKTSCKDCYNDAIIEMIIYIKKYGKMKEKCDYALKNGVLLQIGFGSDNFYTNANLTNKVAFKYLKENPEDENLFSAIPDFHYKDKPAKNEAGKEKTKLGDSGEKFEKEVAKKVEDNENNKELVNNTLSGDNTVDVNSENVNSEKDGLPD